jgi:hypothetical protein
VNTKKCSKCGEIKPVTEFYKRKDSKDGYNGKCKECISLKNKEYLKKNRDTRITYFKQWRKDNQEKHYALNKRKYYENRSTILQQKKFYGKSLANYNTYAHKLTIDESPRLSKDGLSIEIKCRYCGRYFVPTNNQVGARLQALVGTTRGDNYMYCSKHCKKACPVYGQLKYPKGYKKATSREVQPQLRQMVLERDNWTCQKCGRTTEEVELHCHHIFPLNESPIESADVENCITLCKNCHKEAHKLPNCSYHELRCSNQ